MPTRTTPSTGGSGREMTPDQRERTLFVGNLDKRITERHLIQLFTQFGELTRVQFMWHHHGELKGQPRGFAFVEFQDKQAANAAVQQAHGVDLAGRSLVVRYAEDKEKEDKAAASTLDDKTSSHRGTRGGVNDSRTGGDRRVGYDRFAFVPAAIPSSGFTLDPSLAKMQSGDVVLLTALAKVRAIEDKLRAMQEEREFERKIAERGNIKVEPKSSTSSSSSSNPSSSSSSSDRRRDAAFSQAPNPDRRDYVHPSRRVDDNKRRERSRSRSRSRGRERR